MKHRDRVRVVAFLCTTAITITAIIVFQDPDFFYTGFLFFLVTALFTR